MGRASELGIVIVRYCIIEKSRKAGIRLDTGFSAWKIWRACIIEQNTGAEVYASAASFFVTARKNCCVLGF